MVSFQGKYEILSPLSDGESQSFRALQISTGRSVLVHHLAAARTPSQQPDLASLIFRFLRSASADKSRNFLDMGEDEGRIFVVTADVPECLDLRQWLQSVTEAQAGKEGDAQPAAEKTPGFRGLEFTSNFTTEVLHQGLTSPVSEPGPPSLGPRAAPPPAPPPEKSPGDLMPPPQVPAASSDVADGGSTDFFGYWEKLSPASLARYPASISTPPTSEGSGGPSEVPEVTAELLTGPSFLSDGDAPTAPLTNLRAQSAGREPAPAAVAGPAEATGGAGQFADSVLPPPERLKPPLAPREAEVSKLSPQPTVPPAADGPGTKTPREFTGLLVEKDKTPPQGAALSSKPNADDQPQAEVKLADKIPRRQIPMGFEVVFQSSKPRSRPTLSGVPYQSGIMTAPTLITPRTGPEEAAPMPAAAGLPQVAPPAVSPVAERIGGSPAMGFPPAPEEPRQAVGTRKGPSPPPSPPRVWQALPESGKATGLVPAPPVTPVGRVPQAPPGGSASPGGATPPVSAPMPSPPTRAQPGEYTRMIENVKALASPLPPVGPPGVPPAGIRLAANPAVPASAPSQASYLQGPAPDPPPYHEAPPQFRPSLYIAHDTPSHSARQKRKVWVPILILSSLFLMTVALLLFFAFKH